MTESEWKDEIIEEIRQIRQAHAAAHGYDLRRIAEDLRRKQAASGHPVVTLPPKVAKPRRRARGASGSR